MQIHLKIEKLPSIVLCPGDPKRAAIIAEKLKNAECLSMNREYHIYVGEYLNTPIGVVSTGIGGASAAIAFYEAIEAGARCLIRVGTAGKLRPEVHSGDIVIATGAVREDGVSRQLLPLGFPALASYEVVDALRQAAIEVGHPFHLGIVHTTGLFYPGKCSLDRTTLAEAGALCVEMECATLFVLASLRKALSGAVLAIDGEASRDKHLLNKAVNAAIAVALNGAVKLANRRVL